MLLKIIGILLILRGALNIKYCLGSILYGTGFDMSPESIDGLIFMVMGAGMYFMKKWAIVLFTIQMVFMILIEVNVVPDFGMGNEYPFSVIMIIAYVLILVFSCANWKKCKWR